MKHIIILVLISSVCSGFAFSRTTPLAHGPLLIIDTAGSNFGLVPNMGHVEHTFKLRNEGDEPLHITSVRPACGCTIASLKDSIVAPGKSTTLLINFSENNHWPGGFEKEVSIVSNSRDSTEKKFWFYGRFIGVPGSDTARFRTFVKTFKK